MRQIPLTNGGYVTVDDADYRYLSQFAWRKKRSAGTRRMIWHAVRDVELGDKKLTVRMHRLIAEANYDQEVFHINGNGLDNRRRNLQLRTMKPWTGRSRASGYRGVHQVSTNAWKAEITFAGRTHLLGNDFGDPTMAAYAYDDAARKLYGSSARVNFPEPGEILA